MLDSIFVAVRADPLFLKSQLCLLCPCRPLISSPLWVWHVVIVAPSSGSLPLSVSDQASVPSPRLCVGVVKVSAFPKCREQCLRGKAVAVNCPENTGWAFCAAPFWTRRMVDAAFVPSGSLFDSWLEECGWATSSSGTALQPLSPKGHKVAQMISCSVCKGNSREMGFFLMHAPFRVLQMFRFHIHWGGGEMWQLAAPNFYTLSRTPERQTCVLQGFVI